MTDNNADVQEDFASLQGSEETSKDTVNTAMTTGQFDDTELSKAAADEAGLHGDEMADAAFEFPDTSIDLQHVSGSKLVFFCSVSVSIDFPLKSVI